MVESFVRSGRDTSPQFLVRKYIIFGNKLFVSNIGMHLFSLSHYCIILYCLFLVSFPFSEYHILLDFVSFWFSFSLYFLNFDYVSLIVPFGTCVNVFLLYQLSSLL